MTGVICDRRIVAQVKGKDRKMVVRSAVMYDVETIALTKNKNEEAEQKDSSDGVF